MCAEEPKGFRAKEQTMRNHADEILFIENVRKHRNPDTGKILIFGDAESQSNSPKGDSTLGLRSCWVLVDGKLKLIWSGDEDEPLRRVA
jgi:hypothetical protein